MVQALLLDFWTPGLLQCCERLCIIYHTCPAHIYSISCLIKCTCWCCCLQTARRANYRRGNATAEATASLLELLPWESEISLLDGIQNHIFWIGMWIINPYTRSWVEHYGGVKAHTTLPVVLIWPAHKNLISPKLRTTLWICVLISGFNV